MIGDGFDGCKKPSSSHLRIEEALENTGENQFSVKALYPFWAWLIDHH